VDDDPLEYIPNIVIGYDPALIVSLVWMEKVLETLLKVMKLSKLVPLE
jgi:hypothetical protein